MSTDLNTYGGRHVFVDLDGFDRIRASSPEPLNRKVELEIIRSVQRHARNRDLSPRLSELDREWDIDRAVMLAFSVISGTFLTLTLLRKSRRWLFPVAGQLSFLAFHAAKGWCPPAAILRRLGFRSSKEICAEKYALKTLRGDFARRVA